MLARTDVRAVVLEEIRTFLAEESDGAVAEVTGQERVHELGLNSLQWARLVIQLEAEVGADPFAGDEVAISDIRVVDDLVAAYENAVHELERTG
jgi:acyl carrier protein